MINVTRPTWVEIHLDHLAFNFRSVKTFVGQAVKYMAVVKADAYGHGAVECARKLEQEQVDWFGVALPEEALELRDAGIRQPILTLGSFAPGQETVLLENNITPVIFRLEIAELLNRAAQDRGVVTDIHVKIDTGMNRVGVRFDELKAFVEGLKKFENLRVDGVMTHFASADDPAQNNFTNLQIKRFNEAAELFHENGFRPTYRDLANSSGAVAHPDSLGNMVRLGGIIYGLEDILPKNIEKPTLKPVLTLHTKISLLKHVPKGETLGYSRTFTTTRDSLIAILPIGYHDGYLRRLSNCGKVIVNGVYAPVVGRISMDWLMIDATDVPAVKVFDEVVLIGEQHGLRIKTEDLTGLVNALSYEITCGINKRVTRVYKD